MSLTRGLVESGTLHQGGTVAHRLAHNYNCKLYNERMLSFVLTGLNHGELYYVDYSTARFKLYARDYILASINTFSPSSQPMLASKDSILASKGSMLSSKGNMLSCMILLAIEIDARVRLLARIRDRAVSRCTRARLHALVHYFTHDFN